MCWVKLGAVEEDKTGKGMESEVGMLATIGGEISLFDKVTFERMSSRSAFQQRMQQVHIP